MTFAARDFHLIIRVIICAIQVLARGQVGVLFQVLGPKRLADGMFLVEPFTQVNQPATPRAERPVGTGKPVALFLARRAFDSGQRFHGRAQRLSAGRS
jgi:hypothetical protein